MTNSAVTPAILKAGLVLLDPITSLVARVIILQYNPDSLSRTLQAQTAALGENADRSEVMRLKGPPIETLKVEAEIDATDQLEVSDPTTMKSGLFPALSALETILYPTTTQIMANHSMASQGILEILPMESPLILFVWSSSRIVPVRITDLSVTEEAFDTQLNPIRAKVSLGMRVLSVNDLGFQHRGSSIYLAYQRAKESFAALAPNGTLGQLGIGAIP